MWQFAALLLGALVLGIVLSLWQHRGYLAEVNAMAKANAGRDLRLVSGRGKGRLQGAVVVLLVDPRTMDIVEARAMVGATIFSRLKPAPELCGPLATVAERATNKHVKKAAESALEMLPAGLRPAPGPGASNTSTAPGTRIRLPRPKTSI
jgi:DNA-binding transcriptional regulator of glucitol operon